MSSELSLYGAFNSDLLHKLQSRIERLARRRFVERTVHELIYSQTSRKNEKLTLRLSSDEPGKELKDRKWTLINQSLPELGSEYQVMVRSSTQCELIKGDVQFFLNISGFKFQFEVILN